MSISQALSILVALAGTSGAVFGITSILRDRARLVITHHETFLELDDGLAAYVRVYVANAGRQPVSVIGAGLMERFELERWRAKALHLRVLDTIAGRRPPSGGSAFVWPALDEIEDEPLMLRPGEFKKFILVDAADHPSGDQAFRAYAYAMAFGGRISLSRDPVEAVSGHWRQTTWEMYH